MLSLLCSALGPLADIPLVDPASEDISFAVSSCVLLLCCQSSVRSQVGIDLDLWRLPFAVHLCLYSGY